VRILAGVAAWLGLGGFSQARPGCASPEELIDLRQAASHLGTQVRAVAASAGGHALAHAQAAPQAVSLQEAPTHKQMSMRCAMTPITCAALRNA